MKRLTILITAAAALALVGCGDNLDPNEGLGPQIGPDPINKLPPVSDVPDDGPFPQAISFQTPGCTAIGGCETVTFCPNGVGNYEPPNGNTGGGDFVYGVGEDYVWGINSDVAYTFEYKPGAALTSPLGNVLIPGLANESLCESLVNSVDTRSPQDRADDFAIGDGDLGDLGLAIENRGTRPIGTPDI